MDLPGSPLSGGRPLSPERVLGLLMLAGGVMAFIAVLMPPGAAGSEQAVMLCGALAIVAGLLLVTAADRRVAVPTWALGLGALLGTALIGVSTWAGGLGQTGTEDNEVLFLWVSFFAFYFFSLRHALLQLAAVAATYALLLSGSSDWAAAPTRFVVTVGTMLVVGLLIYRLRGATERTLAAAEERARIDELTGVLNRRGLAERAAVEFARSRRAETPVGFLLIDLDQFAMYNELQGHEAGDALLRHVGEVLADSTRGVDAVARLGGDEFGVLLPGADAEELERVGTRLFVALRDSFKDGAVLTTVSVGAACGPAAGHSLGDLWRSADRALSVARATGGDQFRVARDPLRSSGAWDSATLGLSPGKPGR